jgi:hypothetical protein
MLTSDGSSSSGNSAEDGQVFKRPGHDHDKVPIADGAPLKETANPKAVNYQGKPVVQACNLLTIADLNRLGVYYAANPAPNTANYERTYIAADGTAPLKTIDLGFSTAGTFALNKCSYNLVDSAGRENQDSISVAVSQPAYVSDADIPIGQAAGTYVRKPNIGKVLVYSHRLPAKNPGDAVGDGVMRLGDLTVSINFVLTSGGYAGKLDDIATTIAKNIESQKASPTGPAAVTYDSPVFSKSVAQPCQLLTPDTFASTYRTQISPLVVEQPATAVGVAVFQGQNDQKAHDYVTISCARGTGEEDPGARESLLLRATSYLSDESAMLHLNTLRQHGGQNTATMLGDESLVQTSAALASSRGGLAFRKGRFVFELSVQDVRHYRNGLTVEQSNKMLTPAAQGILRNLGNQA